jgi:hypothetical protein
MLRRCALAACRSARCAPPRSPRLAHAAAGSPAPSSAIDAANAEEAADVAAAIAAAAAARAAPATDAALAAGAPPTAARTALVRPVVRMRSGEPAIAAATKASKITWQVLPENALESDAFRFIEPLMGWTGSAEPFASVHGDQLQFHRRARAVLLAQRVQNPALRRNDGSASRARARARAQTAHLTRARVSRRRAARARRWRSRRAKAGHPWWCRLQRCRL